MPTLLTIGFVLFVGFHVAALWCIVAATRHRAPGHRGTAFGIVARGSLAKREEFTDAGWRRWKLAQYLSWTGLLVGAACLLAS